MGSCFPHAAVISRVRHRTDSALHGSYSGWFGASMHRPAGIDRPAHARKRDWNMKTINRRTAVATACLIALAALPAKAAWAQDAKESTAQPAPSYMNGGIGKDEQTALQRVAHEFPLRMIFSERKDGEFVANVPVVITDAGGATVFSLAQAGPMLDVMLPDGKYHVTARFGGVSESQDVTVDGKSGSDLYFHWKGMQADQMAISQE
jgi:hypothetical protein